MRMGEQDLLHGFFRHGFLRRGSRGDQARIADCQQHEQYGQQITKHDINLPFRNGMSFWQSGCPDFKYIITMLMMLGGACWIVLFKLKNKSLIGIGAGLCSAFVAIQLGGYANQVLMQFPNGLIFYGGLSIVYILPYLEPEWIEYENKRLTIQEEKKRVKLEEKLAKRV